MPSGGEVAGLMRRWYNRFQTEMYQHRPAGDDHRTDRDDGPEKERLMGEKLRLKSKGKSPKPSKGGLRPHEVRAKAEGYKSAPVQPNTPQAPKRG